ncbi:MAG: PDZ domain-containing protein [Gemmatimonadetes bacterium]|nr:PDZ domain-containing protein [Gemmatimonadota bacterium]
MGSPAFGSAIPSSLEVAELSPRLARQFGLAKAGGVIVVRVDPLGPAYRKNVEPGDRLLALNRREVRSAREAHSLLRRVRSGEVVSLLFETPDGRSQIANLRLP